MRVEFVPSDSVKEPRLWVRPEQVLGMVLRPGSIEIGVQRTKLTEFRYVAGELILPNRHEGKWIGLMTAPYLQIGISDSALMGASGRANEDTPEGVPLYKSWLIVSLVRFFYRCFRRFSSKKRS